MKKRRKKSSNKLGIVGITLVVVVLGVVLWKQIDESQAKIARLEIQETELKDKEAEQKQRSLDLEERRVYVQTKKYVEEVAKQLGLVYPDEIVFKPNSK